MLRRVAVIFPPNRRLSQRCYFDGFSRLSVKAIAEPSSRPQPGTSNLKVITARSNSTPILGRLFKTVTAPIRYGGVDSTLGDADAIVTIELYSFLSGQFTEFTQATEKKAFVIVWEMIPTHPFYRVPPFRGIASRVARDADGFVTTSFRAAKHLESLRVSGKKIRTIYPGLNIGTFKPAPSANTDTPHLLSVGLLAEHKGFPPITGDLQ